MAKTEPILIDVLEKMMQSFKEKDYAQVQKILRGREYNIAMKNCTDEELKKATIDLYNHMIVATSPLIAERLDDDTLRNLGIQIDSFQNPKTKIPICDFIEAIGQRFHIVVEQINETRQRQASALTKHEGELFEKLGPIGYAADLVKRRWAGDHHAGNEIPIEITVQEKKLIPNTPSDNPINDNPFAFFNQANKKPTPPPEPSYEVITKTVKKDIPLEEKALEEFGGVKLLNTPLKKFASSVAIIAGIGIVVHGVRNVYLSFKPDEDSKLELKELDHEKPDGINWLRLVVGAGEIGFGTVMAWQQITGRKIGDTFKPVVGYAEQLCNHDQPVASVGIG